MATKTELIQKVQKVLRAEFNSPDEWVYVTEGFGDYIHVVVVSFRFKDMRESVKQEMLWSILDQSGLTDEEKLLVTRILPYTPAELA